MKLHVSFAKNKKDVCLSSFVIALVKQINEL